MMTFSFRGVGGQLIERAGDRVEGTVGLHDAPVGEDADDPRIEEPGEFEGVLGEAGLIVEGVLGGEDVLLEARVHFGALGQDALQERRRDGDDFEALRVQQVLGPLQLVLVEVHDVLAADYAQFGAGHADGGHRIESGGEVGRELVGDGGDPQLGCHGWMGVVDRLYSSINLYCRPIQYDGWRFWCATANTRMPLAVGRYTIV